MWYSVILKPLPDTHTTPGPKNWFGLVYLALLGWDLTLILSFKNGHHGHFHSVPAPFRTITRQEEADCNKAMSKIRISVEHAFGKTTTEFAFVDFPKNLKVHLSPVATYYRVAVLLTNAHTCLYGSQTGSSFELDPPTLEEYFTASRDQRNQEQA